MAKRTIDSPPSEAQGWSEIWREDIAIRRRGGALGRVARFFRDILRIDTDRQRDYNIVVADLLRDLRNDVASLHADVKTLHEDLVRTSGDLTTELREKFSKHLPIAVARNDALVAALDQKIEMVSARMRDLSTPLLEKAATATRDDFLYRRLEEGLRGSETEIRAAIRDYVDLAERHDPVLDIGCGRGEFLAMCRERNIGARGFDTNERSVADLQTRGFDVALAGVPHCFAAIGDATIGSILASHVVEHLPVEALFSLFAEASRVLMPGGLLMIETPNAGSVAMSAVDFWRDPTHLAPRHVAALTLIAREFRFEIDELRTTAPYPEANRLAVSEQHPADLQNVIFRLNELLFGDQNLRLVLRKT